MEPSDAPDDHLQLGGLELEGDSATGTNGSVELQPFVTTQTSVRANNGPVDAPEDDVIISPSSGYSSRHVQRQAANSRNVAFANTADEGIANGLQRLSVTIKSFSNSLSSPPPASSAATTPNGRGAAPAVQDSDRRKKMVLLLMATLFVALMAAALEKRTALNAETNVEAGDQENAYHNPFKWGKGKGGDGGGDASKKTIHVIDVEGYQPKTMVNSSDYILPGTEDDPPLSASKGRPYYPILNHFQHRDPSSPYAKKWGYFDFEDPNPKWDGKMRPQPDFSKAPNRDVPNSSFPKDAWQTDQDYMKAFLAEAKLLVNRSIEAVYAEYGVGLPQDGSVELSAEDLVHRAQFAPWAVKTSMADPAGNGGSWTTQKSLEDTTRRFIHHIMTGDTFKLVLGGHSAAAGHGAGFNQSYIIEAGHVLEPVFAHLGVEFRAYNFAQGGMGTFQQALAGTDLRNKEADWVMWDSRMTEKPENLVNFYLRQAIISGNRSPVIMGQGAQLGGFHDTGGASICDQGNGWTPITVSDEQVKEVPWAAQYLQCAQGGTANCKGHEYTAGCWVEREDFKPTTGQGAVVGGAASWHPGNRIHKRRGRMIALIILRFMDFALNKWEELGTESGYPVAEDLWHVTDYYKDIREKVVKVGGCWGNSWRIGQARKLSDAEMERTAEDDIKDGRNLDEGDFWPARLCNIPLQGRSNWGPRDNPMASSLLSIMKPNPRGDIDPNLVNGYRAGPIYQPPDRAAPWTVPPETEPFAPLIGASRRHLSVEEERPEKRQLRGVDGITGDEVDSKFRSQVNITRILDGDRRVADDKDAIVPGLGPWVHWGRVGVCDGSSHSWCDKANGSGCLMGGAQDNRGMVCFNGLSGWVVFQIKNVKHGFIGARMESWRFGNEMHTTDSWTEVNNGGNGNYDKEGRERQLHEDYQQQKMEESLERMKDEIEEEIRYEGDPDERERRLGGGQSCGRAGAYTFEWSIDGGETVQSWDNAEFCKHYTRLNYNLDVVKFMDDESITGDFELAMRMTTPAGKGQVMCLTHMYWS